MLVDVNILTARVDVAAFGLSNTENKTIAGVVVRQGVPYQCYVRLYSKSTGKKVDEVLTDEMGNYSFTGLSGMSFFIVAHDPESQFNAVIQDNVRPK